jgi:hypothetical protein
MITKELYVVAFTHEIDAVTHQRGFDSISFGESFRMLKMVKDIVDAVEKQTGKRGVQLMAVTPLHKIIDYEGEDSANCHSVIPSGH